MTIKEKTEARLKKYVEKYMGGSWRYCGGRFRIFGNTEVVRDSGIWIFWEITHKFQSLTGKIESFKQYGIPDSVQEFKGEEAFEECLNWVVENLIKTHDAIAERVAPYKMGQLNYERALRGI